MSSHGNEKGYISLSDYLKDRFGQKVYKVAIDGGFTCPNRDGTIGTGGCIFCSGRGSGDFAENRSLSVTEQIELGKKRVASKLPKGEAGRYIAYFQAFTNTYAPVDRLRKLYLEAAENPDIVCVSIATRPDCLPEEVLDLLVEVNQIKPVWVELGLQTIHEKSAKYIRRGYDLPVYDKAVAELRKRDIEVITHVILGLPGETREEMLETVKYVGESGVQGIKLQLLHVLEGTDLADDYKAGKFSCMSMDEYVELVHDAINILPDDMVIHRMTGDGPKKDLIAPLWSGDKKRVINALRKRLVIMAMIVSAALLYNGNVRAEELTTEDITEITTEEPTTEQPKIKKVKPGIKIQIGNKKKETKRYKGKFKKKNGEIYFRCKDKTDRKNFKGGFFTCGKYVYHSGKKGRLDRGWYKLNGQYYYFDRSTGRLAISKTVDGIKIGKYGVVKKGETISRVKTYIKARKVVRSITDPTDSKSTKLYKCFKWVEGFNYWQYRKFMTGYNEHPKDWDSVFADDIFDNHQGCCVSEAAALTYLARECGYDNVYICSDSGHGWAEIDGGLYDPLFAEAKNFNQYYNSAIRIHAYVKKRI
ncbi:MAG: TIGR01212 family radical SAM protein [Eubacterium sp.]|nr:TIGR01212 family radical SAM protein [Eubacterium sp.]